MIEGKAKRAVSVPADYAGGIQEGAAVPYFFDQSSIRGFAKTGWIDYNDSSTSAAPVVLSSGVWTDVPNDGAGAFTNKGYAPEGVTELMDVSTGYLDFSQLKIGDNVFIRNDYVVTPDTNNSLLQFRYELGGGLGIYTLESVIARLDNGSGNTLNTSFGS